MWWPVGFHMGLLRFQAVVWCRYYYSETQCRWLISVCKDGKVGHCSKASQKSCPLLTHSQVWQVGCRWWVSITICITIWCSGLPSHCLWWVWGTIRAGGVWRVALRSMKIVYGKVMAVNCTYNNTVYLHYIVLMHVLDTCNCMYCFACTHTAILLRCRIKVIVIVAIWTYKAMDVLGIELWNSNCFVTILWLSMSLQWEILSHLTGKGGPRGGAFTLLRLHKINGKIRKPPRALLNPVCSDMQMSTESEKTVLVHLGERARPVKFTGVTNNYFRAQNCFRDVLIRNEEVILQVGLAVCLYVRYTHLNTFWTQR